MCAAGVTDDLRDGNVIKYAVKYTPTCSAALPPQPPTRRTTFQFVIVLRKGSASSGGALRGVLSCELAPRVTKQEHTMATVAVASLSGFDSTRSCYFVGRQPATARVSREAPFSLLKPAFFCGRQRNAFNVIGAFVLKAPLQCHQCDRNRSQKTRVRQSSSRSFFQRPGPA